MSHEPLAAAPSFLTLSRWTSREDPAAPAIEVASRRRLDTRQVVPYFVRDGVPWVGLLWRERVSRALRGAPVVGAEPVGIDLAGVDETGDVLSYGKAIFTEVARVSIDEAALKIPLPSFARSIGYLCELGLPLLVPAVPPPTDVLQVTWDGATHAIRFAPAAQTLAALGEHPYAEDARLLTLALLPPDARGLPALPPAPLTRVPSPVADAGSLADAVHAPWPSSGHTRTGPLRGDELRFLRALRAVDTQGVAWELVSPPRPRSIAMLPFVTTTEGRFFLVWRELRASLLERRVAAPLFDLPIHPVHVNATACFVDDDLQALARDPAALGARVEALLAAALGRPAKVAWARAFAPPGEVAPSMSTEIRLSVAVALADLGEAPLPADVLVVHEAELCRAIAEGSVRDPTIVLTVLSMGLDPFAEARVGDPRQRLAFVDAMTQGSLVERRLRTYSSIEAEQLGAPTYARLMTLLQHAYGVRIAYPKSEGDRGFFKAAFRVFMADDRGQDRAVQGLHWSHDAYHFGLGNFTLPPPPDFAGWYTSGAPLPPAPEPSGPAFDTYYTALKLAEDEATFFSFWTLFHEQPSLARHVGKLTFWQALLDLGVADRETARAIFDEVTRDERIPARVSGHPAYRRDEVRSLFEYMRGFRPYHEKDIVAAFRFAARDPYRGCFLRYRLYESDLGRYREWVTGFQAMLDAMPVGLDPLLCTAAEARVALGLVVWDVVKALRLLRAAVLASAPDDAPSRRETLAGFLAAAEQELVRLDGLAARLAATRARVRNAELSTANERLFLELTSLAAELTAERAGLWDRVEALGVLDGGVLAAERARELPR